MENATYITLEPKEWLDRVIDNLDELRILDGVLRPEEVGFTALDTGSPFEEFPSVHLGPENVRFFANLLGLPVRRTARKYTDGCYRMETSITYRCHKVFGLDFKIFDGGDAE